jgi:hypothetical protein
VHEHVLVGGLIEWLRNRLGEWADPEVDEQSNNRQEETLRLLKTQLELPFEQRRLKIDDEGLCQMIRRVVEGIDNRDKVRQRSEEWLAEFNAAIDSVFTPMFWNTTYGWSLEDGRPPN